jgi:hypothetical protein
MHKIARVSLSQPRTGPPISQANHHGSKEGHYLAWSSRASASRSGEATANLADPREQVRTGGEVFFSILVEDPNAGRSARRFRNPGFGELGEQLRERRFETVAQIAELIQGGVPETDP